MSSAARDPPLAPARAAAGARPGTRPARNTPS
jgi:hypothetical protein